MNDIQSVSQRAALFGTAALWFLLIAFILFLPVLPEKKVYKTIQIHLSSAQTAAPVKSKAASPDKPASPDEKSSAPAVPAAAKKNQAAKKTPVRTVEKQQLSKSIEELTAEANQAQPKKKVEWDESAFADDSTVSSSSTATVSTTVPIKQGASLQGTAAASASTDSSLSTSSNTARSSAESAAGSATTDSLGAIAATRPTSYKSSGNGVSSSATLNSSIDGTASVEMDDGSARRLLDPAKPVISLSKEAAALIDSSKTVMIYFVVQAAGDVTGIRITPSSILPVLVQEEIKRQISRWRFQSASSAGQASFKYVIQKD